MNFDDLKDKLLDVWNRLRSEVEENPTFNTLREKYETLPSNAQKGILAVAALAFVAFLISIPMSIFSSARVYEQEFVENKTLMRELLKVGKPQSEASDLSREIPAEMIKNKVQTELANYNLLPEQIGDISEASSTNTSLAKPPIKEQTIAVSLKNLNLTQMVQIGYGLQNLFTNLKVTGMQAVESTDKANYFDVNFILSMFSLPPSDAEDGKKSNKRNRRNNK